ncbi:MAG: CDP-diacylglycerol--serine O-phosphatidyltransferase [Syntrophomonas sp.]
MANSVTKYASNFVTVLNIVFGSLAIINIINEDYKVATILIFMAVLMDSMDGRVARKLNTTSDMGKELDSLCDLVSFGVAPAILIYSQVFSEYPGIIGLITAILFIICGALRLARFNVLNTSGYFVGIPITMAGALMVVISILSVHLPYIVIVMLMLLLSYLMISNIKVRKL